MEKQVNQSNQNEPKCTQVKLKGIQVTQVNPIKSNWN